MNKAKKCSLKIRIQNKLMVKINLGWEREGKHIQF